MRIFPVRDVLARRGRVGIQTDAEGFEEPAVGGGQFSGMRRGDRLSLRRQDRRRRLTRGIDATHRRGERDFQLEARFASLRMTRLNPRVSRSGGSYGVGEFSHEPIGKRFVHGLSPSVAVGE
jgi:hypothetical protein